MLNDQPESKRRQAWAVLLMLLVVGAFYQVLWRGFIPLDSDNVCQFVPLMSAGEERLFPLWNPYLLSGYAQVGEVQLQTFYPLRWLYRLFPAEAFHPRHLALHSLLGAIGAWWLLRQLGLRNMVSVCGGAMYAIAGYCPARLLNASLYFSAAWLPWLLGAMHRLLHRPGGRSVALVAGFGALLFFSGSPHHFFYGLVALGVVWLVGLTQVPAGQRARVTRLFVAALLLMLLLSSIQLLPFMEALHHSHRTQITPQRISTDSLHWSQIPALFVNRVMPELSLDTFTFLGWWAVLLGLYALATARAGAFHRWGVWMLLLPLSILMALGVNGPVFPLLSHIPLLSSLGGPKRALILFQLGAAVLAAVALRHWLERHRERLGWRRLLPLAAATAGILFLVAWRETAGELSLLVQSWPVPIWTELALVLGLALAVLFPATTRRRAAITVAALLILAVAECGVRFQRLDYPFISRDYLRPYPATQWVQQHLQPAQRAMGFEALRLTVADGHDLRLVPLLTPDLGGLYRLPDTQGFEPILPLDYTRFVNAVVGFPKHLPQEELVIFGTMDSLLPDSLGVKYVVGNPTGQLLACATKHLAQNGTPSWTISEGWNQQQQYSGLGLMTSVFGEVSLPQGTLVGEVEVEGASGERQTLPLRLGQETAVVLAGDRNMHPGHALPPTAMEWGVVTASGKYAFRNYLAELTFDQPLTPRRIQFRAVRPNAELVIYAVALNRLDQPPHYRRVLDNPLAPAWENERAFPPAWLVHEVHAASDLMAIAGVVREGHPDLRRTALISAGTSQPPWFTSSAIPPDATESAQLESWAPEKIAYSVECASPALMVTTEVQYPGWRATLDGQPTDMVTANGIFRGVWLPAGKHQVVMAYRPRSVYAGAALTFLGLALTGLISLRRTQI